MIYQLAKSALHKFKTTDTISSAHGLLCGYACVKTDITLKNWLDEILEEYNSSDDFEILTQIFNQTIVQLSDAELKFHLLIAEDEDLNEQAKNTVEWCNGFLSGLGLAQLKTKDVEILELIKDISEISKLEINIINNNENHQDLSEIIEFIRISVLLIQETLDPLKTNHQEL